jgi:hypothetical protein
MAALAPKGPAVVNGRLENWGFAAGIADQRCAACRGLGISLRSRSLSPCHCVLRGIFRICWRRWKAFQAPETLRPTADRRREEYVADFELVSRRVLNRREWTAFQLHYLRGEDWRSCSQRLRIDRANFYHLIYRIEARLGRAFRELAPYPLYPVDEYFGVLRRA